MKLLKSALAYDFGSSNMSLISTGRLFGILKVQGGVGKKKTDLITYKYYVSKTYYCRVNIKTIE